MRKTLAIRGVLALTCALVVALAFPAPHLAHAVEPVRVYVFAGQSNMVGKDAVASELVDVAPWALVPPSSVLFWGPIADYPSAWGPLQAPTEILQARMHQGFGPEIGAAHMLARRHPDSKIAVVKFAANGTNLYQDWTPSRPDGLYRRMIARVRTAVASLRRTSDAPVKLAGFFWMQGEADTERLRAAAAYERNLAAFVQAVRWDLDAPRLPFVFGQIADLRRDSRNHYQYSDVVRRAQAGVAKKVPDTYMVSTDSLERAKRSPIHFSSRGTVELGRRFVEPSFPL